MKMKQKECSRHAINERQFYDSSFDCCKSSDCYIFLNKQAVNWFFQFVNVFVESSNNYSCMWYMVLFVALELLRC